MLGRERYDDGHGGNDVQDDEGLRPGYDDRHDAPVCRDDAWLRPENKGSDLS